MKFFIIVILAVAIYILYILFNKKNSQKVNTPYPGTPLPSTPVLEKESTPALVSIEEDTPESLRQKAMLGIPAYPPNKKDLISLVVRPPNAIESKISDSLKEATVRHDAKNLTGAVKSLRIAYKLMEKTNIEYPVLTFTRLPLYLQKAGRFDEAIQELQILLEKGYPKMPKNKGLVAWSKSNIYDKMRLINQREGKRKEAIEFGLVSHAFRCIALKHQKRKDELNDERSKEVWEGVVETLLKKAKLLDIKSDTIKACMTFSKGCSEPTLSSFKKSLSDLINT